MGIQAERDRRDNAATRRWLKRRRRYQKAKARRRQRSKPDRHGKTYESRNGILAAMGFKSYNSYLASDLWRDIRQRVLERDGGMCVVCGENEAHAAHHVRYDRSTLEGRWLHRILSICHRCHRIVEFSPDGKKLALGAARRKTYARMANLGMTPPPVDVVPRPPAGVN